MPDFSILLTESCYKGQKSKRIKPSSKVVDYSDPFAISNLIDMLDSGKYGSVTKEVEALISRKNQMMSPYVTMYPTLTTVLLDRKNSPSKDDSRVQSNVIDLGDEEEEDCVTKGAPTATLPVVVIDSDEEDNRDGRLTGPFQEVILPKPPIGQFLTDMMVSFCCVCNLANNAKMINMHLIMSLQCITTNCV